MSQPVLIALAGLWCAAVMLCVAYMYWHLYAGYQSLDAVKNELGFAEFNFQLLNPWWSRQIRRRTFWDTLSPEQATRVQALMERLRPVRLVYYALVLMFAAALVGGALQGLMSRS